MNWRGLTFSNGGYVTSIRPPALRILMQALVMALIFWLSVANVVSAQQLDMPAGQNEFVRECRRITLSQQGDAGSWVEKHCQHKWQRAINATPMLELMLVALPASEQRPYQAAELKPLMQSVDWLPMEQQDGGLAKGRLGDLTLTLTGKTRVTGMQFHWQQKAATSPYDLTGALRARGLVAKTLGCALFDLASAGQEKVLAVAIPGHQSLVLTLYHRPAPTGIDWGIYDIDAAFGGAVPGLEKLQRGCYPGGGGRAWTLGTDRWGKDCPDP